MNRKKARENAFLLLFEREIKSEETSEEIYLKAIEERGLEVDDYVRAVFFGSSENSKVISEYIEKSLVGWNSVRVSFVSRAILTLAVYEMLFIDDIPHKVSINEAVELAKKYDDDKAYSFVNGVLHSVSLSVVENDA